MAFGAENILDCKQLKHGAHRTVTVQESNIFLKPLQLILFMCQQWCYAFTEILTFNFLNNLWGRYYYFLSKWDVTMSAQSLSHVQFFAAPWAAAHQAPLSLGFPRQLPWSGLPCPPGNRPNPGIIPLSPVSPVLADGFFTTSATWEAPNEISGTHYFVFLFLPLGYI